MRFAELLGRSCFSFLEGASHPEELVDRSAELEHVAIALCDRDGLYGSVRHHTAAREIGHKTIVGAELTLEIHGVEPPPYDTRPVASVALCVENHAGYASLCRLLTAAHADHDKGESGIRADEIAADCEGLTAIIPLDPRCPPHDTDLARLREAFGERCAIATWRHLEPDDTARVRAAMAASQRFDIPIVVSNRPLFHCKSRKPLADVLCCIRLGVPLTEAGTRLTPNAEPELKSARSLARLFPSHPDWIEQSAAIADRCTFSLDELRYCFPSDYGDSTKTPDENLRAAVAIGARDRYPEGVPGDVAAQLDKELVLIADLEVAPYFLSVQQIVDIARERSILCQGRGSAANSAVCYALGITAVDPVRSSLLFERFMSSARREPPDIDVDFEHERREEVIQQIYARYGRDRAAMVSEIISFRGKSALREVGKVFGLAADQLDRLSSIASFYIHPTSHEGDGIQPRRVTDRSLERRGLDPKNRGLRQAVALAAQLEGFPRHLSIHVGGFVLSSEPLYNVAPVEPARMEDRTVIPWDKDDIEELGFFKVDVLGLGMLTAIRKALGYVHEERGESLESFDPIAALDAIPAEDVAVYDACCKADTVGVFQIESRAQMAMLPILRPRNFYDLVVEVGIVRPGPIQGKMVHPYLRRRTGEEEVSYPHPCLEPILRRTLGVPLFQEQVMQLAITGAGYLPGEADQLRRDMAAWRKNGRLARHHEKLLDGFKKRGIPPEFGERLYKQILGFGEYGFPECVVGDTLVLDAASGRRIRIEEVVRGQAELTTTLACDAHFRLKKRRVLQATSSGKREVYRLRTARGRELLATAEHPLLTVDGWRPLATLEPGSHVATARALSGLGKKKWKRHELIVLAGLIAEGNTCHPTTFYFYSTNEAHKNEFVHMVERFPNTRATIKRHRACFSVHVRRADRRAPCGAMVWADELAIRQMKAHEKRLPEGVFTLSDEQIALLLSRLWDGDGGLSRTRHATYDTASPQLAEQVQHLLLRLGISARVNERVRPYRERESTCYSITVTGEDLARFHLRIGRQFVHAHKRALSREVSRASKKGRMSRDIIPIEVQHTIREARAKKGLTWRALEEATRMSMKAVQSRDHRKRGFRRWVIEELGRHLESSRLVDLGTSDIYWDRVVSIERVGMRETYDLTIEGDANFVANDFIVHNSHSASFALLVYASAWLKVHHPAAFAAALINSQPMGFYSPGSIVRDAQKHDVEVRPVRVESSAWDCTLEPVTPATGEAQALRLGLRLVKSLSKESAERIASTRAERPFTGLDDFVERTSLRRDEVEVLAEAGAFEGLLDCRREALWRARAPREGGLFGGHAIEPKGRIGLRQVTAREQLSLDYGTVGISIHDHPMRHARMALKRRRVLFASDQTGWKPNQQVTVGGLVLTRQRPGTASGVVFITLEDETGTLNLVLYAHVFERFELVARHAGMLLARGRVDRRGDVVHIRVQHLERLEMPQGDPLTLRSRDFH